MKTRWKILLVVLLASLYFIVVQRYGVPARAGQGVSQKVFDDTYRNFNEQYFNNRLPKDPIIDYAESGPNLATTDLLPSKQFHIAFNEKYTQSERVVRQIMLHEQCHIKAWASNGNWTLEDYQTEFHGKKWRACMLQLDMQGAFRREMIDYYEGN
jgi:predicted SprT family Zn-dependent metalloprotease